MLTTKQPPAPLHIIRLALMAGVLMFGAVIVFVHRQPTWKPTTLPAAVGYALVAYSIVAILIAHVIKRRAMGESDPARRASLMLVGWSLGEAAGLFGGVMFFLTGESQWYILGIAGMTGPFVTLSPRRLL